MKYRKRPLIVEAERFHQAVEPMPFDDDDVCHFDGTHWYIQTLEGHLRISEGDWIVKGASGEFCRVKNDVFEATYEPAEQLPQ